MSNFKKIVIKYSLGLFILLNATQDISCSDDEDDIGFFRKSPSFVCTEADKENSHEKYIRLYMRINERNSPQRALQPMNQLKSRDSRYGSPKDVRVPIAGLEADAGTLKRPRPEFSSLQEQEVESSENSESECLTLFDILDEKEVYEVQILNATLYNPEVTSGDVDLKFVSPTKLDGYREAGGTTPDLKKNISVLKTLYPKEIKDIESFPRNDERLFSPSVRNLSREKVNKLRAFNFVLHLPDYATREPIVVETEEERAIRKEKQKKEFEALEASLGNLPKQLDSEMETALKPWVPYFNYVEMTKNKYSQGLANKLKWPDLVGAFLRYVAPYMEFLEIEGYEVYFTLKTLNFERKNSKNKESNHILMKKGKCPYGADGLIMNWHHVTRIDVHSHGIKVNEAMKKNHESPYKLVLIPGFIHTEYDALLHPEHYVSPLKDIDRSSFGASREVINETVREKYYIK